MPRPLLSLAILLSGLAAITATARGWQAGVYLFKPLTTILVLALAIGASNPPSALYRQAIVVGLAFSLLGDIFLMLPGDRFVAGLASFLLAHLAYLAAFTLGGGGARWAPDALLPVAVAMVVMAATIWPGLGELRGPVLGYVVVIGVMAWQAGGRWLVVGTPGARMAAVGAALFLASDSLLAVRRFRGEYWGDDALVLATYWAAQWCLAVSTEG